jgi:hypothetical protein
VLASIHLPENENAMETLIAQKKASLHLEAGLGLLFEYDAQ